MRMPPFPFDLCVQRDSAHWWIEGGGDGLLGEKQLAQLLDIHLDASGVLFPSVHPNKLDNGFVYMQVDAKLARTVGDFLHLAEQSTSDDAILSMIAAVIYRRKWP